MDIQVALRYAVSIIDSAEGFSPAAYLDTLAKPPVWTIGHGTTRVLGKPVTKGMTCTKAQADAWRLSDMTACASFVLHTAKVPLNEWQLAALISLCYNIGDGHFAQSSVVEALNLGLYRNAADRFLEYDEAGGKYIKGLATRRARERSTFLVGMGIYVSPAPPRTIESEADVLNDQVLNHISAIT